MSSVATATARYGSPQDLASYSGLSVQTVRRLVQSGKLRGRKVGRRVVIPFADIDALFERQPGLAREAGPALVTPPAAVDLAGEFNGHDLLRKLAATGDAAEQAATFEALAAGIDASPLSNRERFAK